MSRKRSAADIQSSGQWSGGKKTSRRYHLTSLTCLVEPDSGKECGYGQRGDGVKLNGF